MHRAPMARARRSERGTPSAFTRWLGEKQRAGEFCPTMPYGLLSALSRCTMPGGFAPFSACRRRQGRWRTRLLGSNKPLPERGPPTRGDLRRRQPGRNFGNHSRLDISNRMGALRCRGRAMRARGPNTPHAPLFLGLGHGLATDLTKHLDGGDAMLGMGSLTWLTHRHAQPPLRHQKGREGSSGRQQKPAPKSKQRTRQIRWC